MDNHIFRSALGGFNRQDVTEYIERTGKEAAEAARQLEEQIKTLQDSEAEAREALDARTQEKEELERQLQDMTEQYTQAKENWDAQSRAAADLRAEADRHESPFLVVNLNIIQAKYEELRKYFQFAKIYYAVKANPAPEVITLLRDLGSCFDIASIYELDRVLSLGVSPDRISYGNTIKKARDVRYFYERGVRLFATDSEADVRNIAREAPGSRIFCRILRFLFLILCALSFITCRHHHRQGTATQFLPR